MSIDKLDEAIQRAENLKLRVDGLLLASDSYYDESPFVSPMNNPSLGAKFGGQIKNSILKFASDREPIGKWVVFWAAQDIFDNWFKVIDPKDINNNILDISSQKALNKINAKQTLQRAITFERRYGTAVILCAYTNAGNWDKALPLNDDPLNPKLTPDEKNCKLLQITPYRWPDVNVTKVDEEATSLRYGQPEFYEITRSAQVSTEPTKAHWTKVIHIATRLDEKNYEGQSVLEPVYDDLTGYRNTRWGQYQTLYRYGSGFPHIKIPGATKKQIRTWIEGGEFDDLFSRTYFVSGGDDEDIEFKGVQEVTLNPEPYNKMSMENLSMGTRIPQDILKGASAGTISGSEVNERQYFKYITSEQKQVEPIVRDILERLMDTGQIAWNYEEKPYEIQWGSAFEVNKKDQATIQLLQARADQLKTQYMTINELREEKGLDHIEGGDVVIGIENLKGKVPTKSEKEPKEEEQEPSEEEEPDKPAVETRQQAERDQDQSG